MFRLADGRIAVTTRVDSGPGTRAEGAEAELDALLQQGAEAIFAETQPYRYAVWLGRNGRRDEGDVVRRALIAGTDENDRLWGYTGLAGSAGNLAEEERLYAAALRLRPDFAPALYNRAVTLEAYGFEERAYRDYRTLADSAGAARRQVTPERVEGLLIEARVGRATAERDLRSAAELAELRLSMPDVEATYADLLAIAVLTAAHDLEGARRAMEQVGLSSPEAKAALLEDLGPFAEFDSAFAQAVEDWTVVRDRLAVVLAEITGWERNPLLVDPAPDTRARLAIAQAHLGQFAEARATIAPTELYCAYCVRARGLVEAYAGNARRADHWLGEAVRITPSLPRLTTTGPRPIWCGATRRGPSSRRGWRCARGRTGPSRASCGATR